ncbi:hypothetical protein LZD49_30595 [Dyadobacter sp. CY261]|uniref:hypothetical protein n=1 Tax=Dyadobacter sp. CY261 TaxID=2907203 RepID=UPI001F1F8A56|nr:hypothetical protein [Dyadobacter sp. CY261]MCF0074875.1 hypothetical protein [Dyadobacter sp. CY261]
MSKKKEQVKFLKKGFAAVVKAFEKEKDKRKRNEVFSFLTGRISELRQYTSKETDMVASDPDMGTVVAAHPATHLVPSPALVEEIRIERLHKQN